MANWSSAFWNILEFFFPTFDLWLVESADAEAVGMGATGLILGMFSRTTATMLGDAQAMWICHM